MIRLTKILNETKPRKVNEAVGGGLGELLIAAISIAGAVGIRMLVKAFIENVFESAADFADRVRNIVAPPKYMRFMAQLNTNTQFNKEFIAYLKSKGGMSKAKEDVDFVKVFTNLPAFRTAFDKFVKDEKISDKNAKILRFRIETAISNAVAVHSEDMVKRLRREYPELSGGLADGVIPKRKFTQKK